MIIVNVMIMKRSILILFLVLITMKNFTMIMMIKMIKKIKKRIIMIINWRRNRSGIQMIMRIKMLATFQVISFIV